MCAVNEEGEEEECDYMEMEIEHLLAGKSCRQLTTEIQITVCALLNQPTNRQQLPGERQSEQQLRRVMIYFIHTHTHLEAVWIIVFLSPLFGRQVAEISRRSIDCGGGGSE